MDDIRQGVIDQLIRPNAVPFFEEKKIVKGAA